MHPPIARTWVPDLSIGLVVLLLGFWEAVSIAYSRYDLSVFPWIVAIGTAAAVVLVRHAGWWSLGILWALLLLQAVTRTDVMLVELTVAGVAFGLARWGSRLLIWASGLSIPIATIAVLLTISLLSRGIWSTRIVRNLIVLLVDGGIAWQPVVVPVIAAILTIPWLLGLAARYRGKARESELSQSAAEAHAATAEQERSQLEEIARLREGQARLARDVHDVVGHSLTVILAQAESAQFLDGADTAALKRTMANIATSARSSLHEVRAVLASPDGDPGHRSDLDTLVDATRASGNDITVTDSGIPRPMPPELATVAFRVLQEMLTNAIKHGRRGAAISVTREWGEQLRLTVSNQLREDAGEVADGTGVGPDTASGPGSGNGIRGMRRRLESVGGSLWVSGAGAGISTFTASAVLPVRADRAVGVTA